MPPNVKRTVVNNRTAKIGRESSILLSWPTFGYFHFFFFQVEVDAIAAHGKDDPMRVTWIGHATMLVQVTCLRIFSVMFQDIFLIYEVYILYIVYKMGSLSAPRKVPHILYTILPQYQFQCSGISPLIYLTFSRQASIKLVGRSHAPSKCTVFTYRQYQECCKRRGAVLAMAVKSCSLRLFSRIVYIETVSLLCGRSVATLFLAKRCHPPISGARRLISATRSL